jgi:hypothetical protein
MPTQEYQIAYSKTSPLSEDLGVRDLDELDVVLGTKSLDELEVLGCKTSSAKIPSFPFSITTHPR